MQTILSHTETALDARARRAAKRAGLRATKTRWRQGTVDNYGQFQLVDFRNNVVVLGVRFDATAAEVIKYCLEEEANRVQQPPSPEIRKSVEEAGLRLQEVARQTIAHYAGINSA